MGRLYEINEEINKLFDEETGEIIDLARVEELQLEQEKIVEYLALEVKNCEADALAYKNEKDNFAARQKHAENRAAGIKRYLSICLNGEKFKTDKVDIGFRSSQSVEVNIERLMTFDDCDSYLKYKDPEPDKARIKEAMKLGIDIPGCSIVNNKNIQIK